jgi:CDP-glycerol glycerophosphotransferase (TagB/SpsB family)
MSHDSPIAYFIDFSIHEIPSVAYIAYEAGGTLYTNSEITFRCIKTDHPSLSVQYHARISAMKEHMLQSHVQVIVYPDYHLRYFKDLAGVKHVQVFHGISDKKYDYQNEVLEYDLFFIPGKEAYERYEQKGLLKRGTGVLIGCPKMDRVFRGELQRDEMLRKLRLDPANKTVLYAPTWVDKELNSSWKRFRSAFVKNKPPHINLLVKLHPNLRRYREPEVERFSEELKRFANTQIYDLLPDIVPLFAASDLLASDVSSVTREYLALRRPFLFLSNKPVWMWKKNKILLWDCGDILRTPKRLWDTIERTLDSPDKYGNKIQTRFEDTFYKPDGRASHRAARAILQLLNV